MDDSDGGAAMSRIGARSEGRLDTREELVRIGTEIWSEQGFCSTGIEHVLRRAGVPKGSFYHYFASKDEFGLAVVDNYARLWELKLTRIFGNAQVPPLDRVRNYLAEGIRGMEKHEFRRGCLVGNLAQELAALSAPFRERISHVFASWEGHLTRCLTEAQRTGSLRSDADAAELARFFWTGWEGAILMAKLDRSTVPLEQFRDVLFRWVLRP